MNITIIKKQYNQNFFCLRKTCFLNKIQMDSNLIKLNILLKALIILNLFIL